MLTACPQTVPGRLDMVSDPVVDCLVIFLTVLDILVNLARVVCLAWSIHRYGQHF